MSYERAGRWVWEFCRDFQDDDTGWCMDCGYHYRNHRADA